MTTPTSDYETTAITVPPKAAAIILALAQQRDIAQLRLDDAGNMARAMCDAPAEWELKAENGNVYFAPPQAP